jgi:hypothetical protein
MTVCVPHSSRPRYALALIAGTLFCAGAAHAADPTQPSGKPLWNAYPLDNGSHTADPASGPATTTTAPLPIAPLQTAPLPQLRTNAGGTPMALQIAFFGCLGAVLLITATATLRRATRRRRAHRAHLRRMGAS